MYEEHPTPQLRRRHSVASTAIWPWQMPTVPVPPGRPSSSSGASPKRSYIKDTKTKDLRERRASTGGRVNDSDGNRPPLKNTSWAVPGSRPQTVGEEEAGSQKPGGVRAAVEARPNQDDPWLSMTTREKRRLWLHRRRSGEFYFRSEFKGLVHAVMVSRGWKPSCPPRVPDEELTTPYVDHWEESQDILDSSGAISGPPEEPHLCTLPSVAVTDHGDGNGSALGTSSCGVPTTAVVPSQQENSHNPCPGRSSQPWDLHWSYTKWAVETMRFARKLAPWQKVNHFRNSNELCRKDLMLKNLKKRRALLIGRGELAEAKAYSFFPVTFELPKDYALFAEEFKESGGIWVMKPSGAAEGRGIFLFTKLSAVQAWAKPHLTRRMKRHDPAKPASYVVQRYISNPYLVGGKKFDLRIYVLVTSFRPLTVYIYRDGFAKFSSARFSTDHAHLQNELMHLTNHAVQRRGKAVGNKWRLKKFKIYVAMRHGRKAMDKLFWDIQALVVRTVRAVDRLVIHDAQSFELFGYDVLVDETLRPWLLEVNASPSLGASNREDLRLKKQMVGDALDIVDVEGRVPPGSPVREHVGGFDLAFHKGYAEVQPQACGYSSLLGAVVRNPLRQSRRNEQDKGKFSAFPLPRAASASLVNNGMKAKAVASLPHDISIMQGASMSDDRNQDPVGLAAWRPNYHIFRPQDYWRGSVDYVPWNFGDGNHCNRKDSRKGAKKLEGVELKATSSMAGSGKKQDECATASAGPVYPCSNAGLARLDAGFTEDVGQELGVNANQLGAADRVGVGEGGGEGEDGVGSVRCASNRRTSLKGAEVETALHSVLDALGKVREERLRLTTRSTRARETEG